MDKYFATDTPPLAIKPAPMRGTLDDREKVASFLLCPERVAGIDQDVSDIHVFAHGKIGSGWAERFTIPFNCHQGRFKDPIEFSVRALDIDDAIEDARAHAHPRSRPLIWFNCCTAAGPVGKALLSISVRLAQEGCGVIAPRTRVPTVFAATFASKFYPYLRRHPVPGEALLAARLEALEPPSNNPLGLLFTGLGRLV
jgi:hypothetical protein